MKSAVSAAVGGDCCIVAVDIAALSQRCLRSMHERDLPELRTLAHYYTGHCRASPQHLHLALGNRRSRLIHIATLLDHGLFGPGTRGRTGGLKHTYRGQTRCRRCRRGFLGCRVLSETTHSQVVCDSAAPAASGRGRVAYASLQNVSQSFPKLCRGTCLQPYQHLRNRVPAGAKNGSAEADTGMRHPGLAYHELFIFAHVVRRRGLKLRAIRR